mmetsp:Transcript_25559/g.52896  ORF Transcript_25559/g.52896 Transcript_25559/m.52896 type:complete len:226 (+) Transcript_25559:268-945(+)
MSCCEAFFTLSRVSSSSSGSGMPSSGLPPFSPSQSSSAFGSSMRWLCGRDCKMPSSTSSTVEVAPSFMISSSCSGSSSATSKSACSSALAAFIRFTSESTTFSFSSSTPTTVSSVSSIARPPTSSTTGWSLSWRCLMPALTEISIFASRSYLRRQRSRRVADDVSCSSWSSTILRRWPPPGPLYLISSTRAFIAPLVSFRASILAWFSLVRSMRFSVVPSWLMIF